MPADDTYSMFKNKKSVNLENTKMYKKRYWLSKMMGKGIQGWVYSAYDLETAKKVALKIFNKETEDITQQKREIKILKQLSQLEDTHGFPGLIDYCKKKGKFIVTELLSDR